MQHLLAFLMMSLLTLQNAQGTPPKTRIARVPEGAIAQNVYLNDALDVSFQINDDWSATLIPTASVEFAPELVREGLATQPDVDQIAGEMMRLADDETTLFGFPLVVQVWAAVG